MLTVEKARWQRMDDGRQVLLLDACPVGYVERYGLSWSAYWGGCASRSFETETQAKRSIELIAGI